MDVITIPSRSGPLTVDFDNRMVTLTRQGMLAKTAGKPSMTIPFDQITHIELREPTFTTLGGCTFIINNVRYVTAGGVGEAADFAVDKNNFPLLKSTLERVIAICGLGGFLAPNTAPVPRVEYGAAANPAAATAAQTAYTARVAEVGADGAEPDEMTQAKLFAQSLELQVLKAPATAQFCSPEEMTATVQNGVYTVSGYVDAQNSYGAMIRTPFTFRVMKDASGWKNVTQSYTPGAGSTGVPGVPGGTGTTGGSNAGCLHSFGIILMLLSAALDIVCMFMIRSSKYDTFQTLLIIGSITFFVGLVMTIIGRASK